MSVKGGNRRIRGIFSPIFFFLRFGLTVYFRFLGGIPVAHPLYETLVLGMSVCLTRR